MHDWTLFEQRHGGSPAVLIQRAHEAYRTFEQASRLDFRIEPYGYGRCAVERLSSDGKSAIAVRSARTRRSGL